MDRQQLAPRDRAELVAEPQADLLVGLQRLGEVAAGPERVDQPHPGRLSKRRRGDRPTRELLGQRWVERAGGGGGHLERLHPCALGGVPRLAQPVGLVAREQARLEQLGGLARVSQPVRRLVGLAGAGERRLGDFDVHPRRVRQSQHDARASVDLRRGQRAAQA